MNKKNLVCILLIIIVVGVYYNYQKSNDQLVTQSSTDVSDQPVYQSDDMVTDIFDLSGEIMYKIESSKVRHFDDSNNTEFDSPKFTFYDRDNSATWLIRAKKAILTNDKYIHLHQDVQLDNLTPDAQLQKVTTDNAVVDLTTQLVTSKDPVAINGIGFYSTGIGLNSNLQTKIANILENIKTYYYTETEVK